MKAVMISVNPKWCELIANGQKTIELRKTKPKLEPPFKCYIYETKGKTAIPTFIDEEGHAIYRGRGQVIGEFICDRIIVVDCDSTDLFDEETTEPINNSTCLDRHDFWNYTHGYKAFGWHISDLKIYYNPKELSIFYNYLPDKILESGDYDCRGMGEVYCIELPCKVGDIVYGNFVDYSNEIAKIIFTALIKVNEQPNESISFASSSVRISADKTQRIQQKVVEIMDILNEDGAT